MVEIKGFKIVYNPRDSKEIILIENDEGKIVIETNVDRFYHRWHCNIYECDEFPTWEHMNQSKLMDNDKIMKDIKNDIQSYYDEFNGEVDPDFSCYFPSILEDCEPYDERTTTLIKKLEKIIENQ